MTTYQNAIATAEQILAAYDCKHDPEFGWYFSLGDKLNYYTLDEATAERVIDEELAMRTINWHDYNLANGTIEINGKQIDILFNLEQQP